MASRLVCYYGDDFTGSTDALEALAANGVDTVLFLDPPDEQRLSAFPNCRAIGVAGESRSRSPEWMTENLPGIFQKLRDYGAPIVHYKVCSTFDSSPKTGNIGRVLEIGRKVFDTRAIPIVVAAPHLQRYVLFGNLFAAGGGSIHRIDRHPTMAAHPVTPMDEADLRLHLGKQTNLRIALLDIRAVDGESPEIALDKLRREDPDAILFDGLGEKSLSQTGKLLWTRRPPGASFAIGSSGLNHALIRQWREDGLIGAPPSPPPAAGVDRLLVMSGSCSPVTEGQICRAMNQGFIGVRLEKGAFDRAQTALTNGHSVVLFTALGPADRGRLAGGDELGRKLGTMLHDLLLRSGVRRAVVAGGDTSSHAVRQLGIHALTFHALMTPGAPLCSAHSDDPAIDGLELVLKGGQVGPEDFFAMVQRGQ
jgi:uncharacterized protein YgbK (DUF1537 family)